MMNVTCPCCGYISITGEGDICPICGWEHEITQETCAEHELDGPKCITLGRPSTALISRGYLAGKLLFLDVWGAYVAIRDALAVQP